MTRSDIKVTPEEVEAALDALIAEGVRKPGAHRLRKHIGHGNIARIQRLRDEILAQRQAEKAGLDRYPLPDDISKQAHALYASLLAAVEEKEVELEKAFLAKAERLEAERDTAIERAKAAENNARTAAEREATVRSELEAARNEINSLLVENKTCKDEIDRLNDALDLQKTVAKSEIENAKAQVRSLTEQLAAATDTHKQFVARSEKDAERWQAQIADAQKQTETLTTDNQTLSDNLAAAREQIARLDAEATAARNENETLKQRLAAAVDEKTKAVDKLAELQQTLAEISADKQHLAGRLETLESRIKELQEERNSQDALRRDLERQIGALEERLARTS